MHTAPLVAWALAVTLGAQTSPNLLLNGSGESANAARLGQSKQRTYFDLPDWTIERGEWFAQSSGWAKVTAKRGELFIRAGDAKAALLTQEVELDGSPSHLVLSGWVRTSGRDRASLRIDVLDELDASLASATTGEIGAKGWTFRHLVVSVPRQARRARVSLGAHRRQGTPNDAYFDDVRVDPVGRAFPPGVTAADALDRSLPKTTTDEYFVVAHAWTQAGAKGIRALERAANATQDGRLRDHLLTLALLSSHRDAAAFHRRLLVSDRPAERALAATALGHVDIDWFRTVGNVAAETEDPKRLAEALAVLAESGETRAFAQLRRAHDQGNAARKAAVLKALRESGFEAAKLYRPFLAPHLDRSGDRAMRRVALETLGVIGDRRYLRHFSELVEAESNLPFRRRMFTWCARFDSLAAIETMLPFVEDDLPQAAGMFLAELPKMKGPEAGAWARRIGIRHDLSAVRQAALERMRIDATAADFPTFERLSRDPDLEVGLIAIKGLANVPGEDSSEYLLDLVGRDHGRVSAAALRAACEQRKGDEAAFALAVDQIENARSFELRVAAIEVLSADWVERSRDVIVESFEDRSRQVRTAAYHAIAKLRNRGSVETLVARLDEETGTTRGFLIDALIDLTGQDRGDRAADWKRWWAIVAADFTFPEPGATARRDRKTAKRTVTEYYDIPIRTDRLVFVVDLSGSMSSKAGGATRLEQAKRKLIEVVLALDRKTRFNIVTFSTEPEPWQDGLVRASSENVDDAVRWVERLKPGGSTNIYDSIELALRMDDVESIFLLSDGAPSSGKYVASGQIRQAVRERNRDLKVRINTISIGGGKSARDFMEALAEENWGTSSEPKQK